MMSEKNLTEKDLYTNSYDEIKDSPYISPVEKLMLLAMETPDSDGKLTHKWVDALRAILPDELKR